VSYTNLAKLSTDILSNKMLRVQSLILQRESNLERRSQKAVSRVQH